MRIWTELFESYGLDANNARNSFLERALNALLECDGRRRTGAARPLQPHADDPIDDIHQLDIAAVRDEGRTDVVQGLFNLPPKLGRRLGIDPESLTFEVDRQIVLDRLLVPIQEDPDPFRFEHIVLGGRLVLEIQ